MPESHECPRIELARAPKEGQKTIQQIQKPYEYTVTYIPVETKRKFNFSGKEVKHLAIAALIVFGIGLSLGLSPTTYAKIGSPFMLIIFAAGLTASFFIHELAHKFTAHREGLWAEFRLMFMGLILTAISIVSPLFKIISPGAVIISGFADKKSIGKISLAGPLTNVVLSMTLITLWLATYQPILLLWAAFNAWIALFNIVPFGLLDGFKVFLWNKIFWTLAFTVSLILTVFSSWFIF